MKKSSCWCTKAVEMEMEEIEAGRCKPHSFQDVRKILEQ